ncbi:hypothetical protein BGZ76_003984, partial [Entomortierella beljakovae]
MDCLLQYQNSLSDEELDMNETELEDDFEDLDGEKLTKPPSARLRALQTRPKSEESDLERSIPHVALATPIAIIANT